MKTFLALGLLAAFVAPASANGYRQTGKSTTHVPNSQKTNTSQMVEGRDFVVTHHNVNGDRHAVVYFEGGGGKRVTIDKNGHIYW